MALLEKERPFVFTPGSGNIRGHEFFQASADACRRLGRPALFLTHHPEQLPSPLPPHVHHRDFAPLSQVLHLCSGLAHHGGIGTTAAGIAAGVPQIIMPLSHDQPDNAARVVRHHIGGRLHPWQFTAGRLARLIEALDNDATVTQSLATRRQQLLQTDGLARTCELIEAAL